MREAPLEPLQLYQAQDRGDSALPLQPGKSQHFQRQRNIFLDRAPRKQHCILEHQADLMRFACRIDGLTVDGHRTGTGTYQSGDHSEYGRFSEASRPEKAHKFLVANRQLDLFERMDLPPAGIEYFGNVGQRDDRLPRLGGGNIIDPNRYDGVHPHEELRSTLIPHLHAKNVPGCTTPILVSARPRSTHTAYSSQRPSAAVARAPAQARSARRAHPSAPAAPVRSTMRRGRSHATDFRV